MEFHDLQYLNEVGDMTHTLVLQLKSKLRVVENTVKGEMWSCQLRITRLFEVVFLIACCFLITFSAANNNHHHVVEDGALVSRIAFGSCSNQTAPQMIWNAIMKFEPQVFIWLGDNIYGDNKRPFRILGKQRTVGPWKNVARFYPSSEHEMQSKFNQAKTHPVYSLLRNRSKVIGTWDDHDYGLNDAGKEFAAKITNQKLLLDFLDEPLDSPRRKQAGVYTSYTFGPVGTQIKVILLDTRYHRDSLSSDGSVLGSAQWEWLEKQLYGPPTAITIIGSSIQRDGVLFISGDVHFAEIARYDCATGYPLYDITSSGLTQSIEGVVPPSLRFFVRLMAWFIPTTVRVAAQNCRYKSWQPNFGVIEVEWKSDPVILKAEVRDTNGLPVISKKILLSGIQAGNLERAATNHTASWQKYCSLEVDLPWIVRYRMAILVFSALTVLLLAFVGLACSTIILCRKWHYKCKHD
ncbi:Complement decay-accelerating factor [Bienertia sinuspersici]